ncbi:MAG: methyltransferase domain-containing protein [Caldilineaceae bacterium]
MTVDGTAEARHSLAPATVDLITVAQAFHWFDAEKRREFERILRPGGWVVLAWNSRRLDSTPFLRGYESLLRTTSSDPRKRTGKMWATMTSPLSLAVKPLRHDPLRQRAALRLGRSAWAGAVVVRRTRGWSPWI